MVNASEARNSRPGLIARYLLSLYTRVTLWYLLGVGLCAILGLEAIYLSPTPFHALFLPASDLYGVPILALYLAGALAYAMWRFVMPAVSWSRKGKVFLSIVVLAGLALLSFAIRHDSHAFDLGGKSLLAVYWSALRGHLLILAVFFGFATAGFRYLQRIEWGSFQPARAAVRWFLVGVIVFSILFSSAVAMVRGGSSGISDAYQRSTYEYIGDVGKTPTIRAFLHDYNKLHPYLSMHAKVHPPGPVVMLWLLSIPTFSTDPLVLSILTILVGSTALIPLFLWVCDLFDARMAFMCTMLYTLVPSIVLFTATSADILLMPMTLWMLYFFWRAIHRGSRWFALAAGVMYALLSLSSFSHLTLGAFFGFVGLWRLREPGLRIPVVQTAILMVTAFFAVHIAVRLWSGFDIFECFRLAKSQFDEDQANLELVSPRFPGWTFPILNPVCWFFFAGIPTSVLFLWRLARPVPESKALFVVFALTLVVLDLLYLARGEGERSAMYIVPFVAIPAAHLLDDLVARARSYAPLVVTFGFLVFQCWMIETFLYTFW